MVVRPYSRPDLVYHQNYYIIGSIILCKMIFFYFFMKFIGVNLIRCYPDELDY